MVTPVGFKRLFLQDAQPEHLRLLVDGVKYALNVDLETWVQDWGEGRLVVFEIPGGLIGLRRDKTLFVEFLVGRGVASYGWELLAFLKQCAQGRQIELVTVRPGMVRLLRRYGFQANAAIMRY